MRPHHTISLLLIALLGGLGCASLGQLSGRGSATASGKSSKAVAAEPEATGWIVPSEFFVDDAGLHYAAYLADVPRQAEVELVLGRPDGSTESLYKGSAQSKIGNVRLEGGSTTRVAGGTPNRGEPVPLEGLKPGTYSLTLRIAAAEKSRETFEVIEVPDLVGGTRMRVSPAGRIMKPYLQATGIALWATKTAASDLKSIEIFWFTDGEPKRQDHQRVFSPRIGLYAGQSNLAMVDLAATVPYVFRSRTTNGKHEFVLVSEGKILGAGAYEIAHGRVEGLVGGVGGRFGPLGFGEPSVAARTYVESALAKREASPEAEDVWPEPTYCAMAKSEKAREAAVEMMRGRRTSSGSPGYSRELEAKMKNTNLTQQQRERARVEKNAYEKRGRDQIGKSEKHRDTLEKIASAYQDGCLAEMMPPALATALAQ